MKNRADVDIILMDIKMPEIDGLEATRQIRQFNKEVIIIAQTAYAMTGDREKAMKAGCTGYITKPVDAKLLIATLSKSI
jgi:CheY-like chemotaxis protein